MVHGLARADSVSLGYGVLRKGECRGVASFQYSRASRPAFWGMETNICPSGTLFLTLPFGIPKRIALKPCCNASTQILSLCWQITGVLLKMQALVRIVKRSPSGDESCQFWRGAQSNCLATLPVHVPSLHLDQSAFITENAPAVMVAH